MIGVSRLRASRISRIVLVYDTSAPYLPPRRRRPVSYVHDTWAKTKPPEPNQGHEIPASPPSLMLLSDLPPVLSNCFRSGCNQPDFSSQQEQMSSTISASCVRAHTPDCTNTAPTDHAPVTSRVFSKLYEPAFRMERKKELDELTTPKLDQSEKHWRGCFV